ncbi:hypothetical protein M426DRAFT_15313 [Hypoxylon sp. CI-4A]|nr:hypothetical protein M426DRAFT_15313 [Hypoxylon sp. CI-4A]
MPSVDDEHTKRLRRFFSDAARFKFVKTLYGGDTGFCACFVELGPGGKGKFVVKCSRSNIDPELMSNDLNWLQTLVNASHIVNILTISNNPLDANGGINVPYMILEYLENGTLTDFMDWSSGKVTPNRVLWRIFLCLVKACVAMAWPPAQGRHEEPRNGVNPISLAHRDMHSGNFIFGPRDATFEHGHVPILKLIDFDDGQLVQNGEKQSSGDRAKFDDKLGLERYLTPGYRNYGIDTNLLDIGLVMCYIILGEEPLELEDCREQMQDKLPNLDDDLQWLVLRCLAVNPENRPRLDVLFQEVLNAVATKTAASYRGKPTEKFETDSNIREFIQSCILDAESGL